MPKGASFINDLLKLFFQGTAIADLADNDATTPLTVLYAALHTASPGAGGSQTTSEAAYAGYARIPVTRSSVGFTVSGAVVSLASAVTFPACSGGTETETFWSIGTALSGAGKLLWWGPLGTNLGVATATAADVLTIPGLTGVSVNDQITFFAPTGGTIPTGITAGTVYFVLTVSTNDITISTTLGGSTLNITAAGQALAYKVSPIAVSGGVAPQLTTASSITEL